MKTPKTLPSCETILKYLTYNSVTGYFRWAVPPGNGTPVGAIAGSVDSHTGYRKIVLEGTVYKAHRLAWKLYYGKDPVEWLDHINRVRDDNRIVNLREASPAQNTAAGKVRSDNTTGVKGVQLYKGNRYRVLIQIGKKRVHLGLFDTIEEATAAYQAAAEQQHGEFAEHGVE